MPTDNRPKHTIRAVLSTVVVAGVTLTAALGIGAERLRAAGEDSASTTDAPAGQPDAAAEAGPVPGAAGAELRTAVPGLYVPDDVDAQVEPSGSVTMRTPRPCAELTDIVLAGDWRRTQRLDVPAEAAPILAIGGLMPMTLLRQGDGHALLTSSDRPDGCRAAVTVAPAGTTSIDAGIVALGESGWAHTTRCMADESTMWMSVVAGGDGVGTVLQLVVDGAGPDRAASLDDSSDSMMAIGDVGVLDALSSALAAQLAGATEDTSGILTVDGDGSTGRATVDDSGGVVRGTVELSGATWFDEQNGQTGELRVSLPFACPEVTTLS
jgi:hypothetical protein